MRKFLLYFSFIVLSLPTVSAQQHDIDSLKNLLGNKQPDTVRVGTMNYLTYLYENSGAYGTADSLAQLTLQFATKISYQKGIAIALTNIASNYDDRGDFKNALQFYQQALDIKKHIGDKHGAANTYNGIGLLYRKQGDYLQAIGYFNEAIKSDREMGDSIGVANALDNIGGTYIAQSEYSKALDNDFSALKIREQLVDSDGMAKSDLSIGECYLNLTEYDKAVEYYTKGMKIDEKLGDQASLADIYSNLGQVYTAQDKNDKALAQYFKALEIEQKIGNPFGEADCYTNIAENYTMQKKYDDALSYSLKGLDVYRKIDSKQGVAVSYRDIGNCYLKQGKYDDALDYENKAIEIGRALGDLQVMQTSMEFLSSVYEATGKDKQALRYYKNFIALRDSIYSADNTKKSVQAEMNYDFEKKQAVEAAEQEKKDAIATADKHRQQAITGAVGLVLVLVIVFSGLLYSRFRITQKQKVIIEEQKTLVEHQKSLVEEKNKEVYDSITYAKRLQDAILPPLHTIQEIFPESFLIYKPKDIIAGDFYWMERAPFEGEDIVLIAAADCTGHGVPGAMVSVVCSNALKEALKEFKIRDTGKMLDKVRELVVETFKKSESSVQDGMDISFCAINLRTKEVEWSGAYNPLWYVSEGELKEIKGDKQPVARYEAQKPFSTHTLYLKKGDMLYLFTDGYADQFGGPAGKKFKYKPFMDIIAMNSFRPVEEQKNILDKSFNDWKGNLEQTDDVCVVGIRI